LPRPAAQTPPWWWRLESGKHAHDTSDLSGSTEAGTEPPPAPDTSSQHQAP
jgi:hypothetical protein